jgi:acyl carrier protein
MAEDKPLGTRVKELIIERLGLKLKPEDIDDEALLFGGDFGLDSIDALELVVVLENSFKVKITDQAEGEKVLRSIATIVRFLEEKSA